MIDTEKFIGWPMTDEFGGYPLEEKVLMYYDELGRQKNKKELWKDIMTNELSKRIFSSILLLLLTFFCIISQIY